MFLFLMKVGITKGGTFYSVSWYPEKFTSTNYLVRYLVPTLIPLFTDLLGWNGLTYLLICPLVKKVLGSSTVKHA